MRLEQWVGIGAGVFTALSLTPQLVKIMKEKKSESLSLPYLLILLSGLGLWIWYGFLKKDLPVILTNITSAVLNIFTLIVGARYKKRS